VRHHSTETVQFAFEGRALRGPLGEEPARSATSGIVAPSIELSLLAFPPSRPDRAVHPSIGAEHRGQSAG
jgi:hypothetical protein